MGSKILIVDDSRTMRQQLVMSLRMGDYEVMEATDGREGLALVAANRDAKLLITDVNMPNMDGLTMIEQLRARRMAPGLAILVVTTEMDRSLRARAKNAGAKGWIVKPVRPEALLSAARQLIGR